MLSIFLGVWKCFGETISCQVCFAYPSVFGWGEWILFGLEPFTLHGALVYDSISADQLVTARGYTPAVVIYLHVITPILASTSIRGMAGMQVAPWPDQKLLESVGHVDVGLVSRETLPCRFTSMSEQSKSDCSTNSWFVVPTQVVEQIQYINSLATKRELYTLVTYNTKRCTNALSGRGLAWRHATLLLLDWRAEGHLELGRWASNHSNKTTIPS